MSDIELVYAELVPFQNIKSPELSERRAKVGLYKSQISNWPPVPSSIPDFLAHKISTLKEEIEFFNFYQREVGEIFELDAQLPIEQRLSKVGIDGAKLQLLGEVIAIQLGEKMIAEDMGEELECSLTPSMPVAYLIAMKHRLDMVRKSRRSLGLDEAAFKKRVLKFYKPSRSITPESFSCPLAGRKPESAIHIAHISPNPLDEGSLSYLYGTELKSDTDPRNALPVCRNFQLALNFGYLVLVPVFGEDKAWKCVLTRTAGLHARVFGSYTWKDADGRQLQFTNDRRPRQMYIFWRYLITYLRQKRDGNVEWHKRVKAEVRKWTGPGEHNRHSMLRDYLQKLIGVKLPVTIFQMFDGMTEMTDPDVAGQFTSKEKEKRDQLLRYAIDKAVEYTTPQDPCEESDSTEESDSSESSDWPQYDTL